MTQYQGVAGRAACRFLCVAALALGLAACSDDGGNAQAQQNVTLKIAHFLPANSNVQADVMEPWCEELKAQSQGRIQCQIYPSLQLGGTAATLVDQVRTGIADIVWTSPGYSPGRFPRIEVLELPFMLPHGGTAGDRLIWQFYENYAKEDFADYKMLALFGDAGQDVHVRARDKEFHGVKTLEDFRGLKLRTSGRTAARTLEALGATPVSMPPAQMTESISKGVIDGALASWEVVPPTKLDEVTHYHSNFAEGHPAIGYTVLTMLMNPASYERLPPDLKEIIDRNTGSVLVERFGESFDRYITQAKQLVSEDTMVAVSDAEFARWQEATAQVADEWVRDASERGINAQELLDAARQLRQSSP